MRGKTCKDGGGTPGGMPSGYIKGTIGLDAISDAWWPDDIDAIDPPAAKTAGGIAWMSVSRWCIRSSSVAVRLKCRDTIIRAK